MKDKEEEENLLPMYKVDFGLNFGAYFANKYSANFYNGSPGNVNNINYLFSDPNRFRELRQALGIGETDTRTTVTVDGYPTNMHYNVSIMGGLFARINLDRKNGLIFQANYTQLKAADVVTLLIDPNIPYYDSLPNLVSYPIIGKEGRVMIDLGYHRSFPLKSRINIFLQGGLTMCYTQVKQSIFVVNGREFNLVNIYGSQGYQPNTNQQTLTVNQNAFGFGGFLGVGAGIPLNDLFGIEPGFYAHYYPTNLEGYPDFKPSFGLYLRILLHFVSSED